MSEMVAAALRGEAERAAQLDAPLSALHRELFVEANPIPTKWLLTQMGLISPGYDCRSRRLRPSTTGACVRRRAPPGYCP